MALLWRAGAPARGSAAHRGVRPWGGRRPGYPPRRLGLSEFPPLDAVLITHEHEDHFNIPSLNRLDRRIPIVLPARASTAARTILQEMGFRVLLATPGQRIAIKDLELFLLGPDHVATDNKDEWDVLQFLVRDDVRDGNLFCAVVVQMTEEAERALAEVGPPGLWCMTNN